MNEQAPHHGPITPQCPLECLLTVASRRSYNRLKWADCRPRTVGDVLRLHASGELPGINGLGPRHTAEITTALTRAGLDTTPPPARPRTRRPPVTTTPPPTAATAAAQPAPAALTPEQISEWASGGKASQVAASLAREITGGTLRRYAELPASSQLAREHDVSERTVSAAKKLLADHGILKLENRRYHVA